MNKYDITILYAEHDSSSKPLPDFSRYYSGDPGRLQVIPVKEEDVFFPRRFSIRALSQAEGDYILMLDKGDQFEDKFLDRLLGSASADTAFVMPALSFQYIVDPFEAFLIKNSSDISVDVRTSQLVFPMDLHGLLIPAAALKKAAARLSDPEDASMEPEKRIILDLLREKPVLKYLGTCLLKYAFPKECNSEHDMRSHTLSWYYEPLRRFLLPLFQEELSENGSVSPLLQCMALHMLNIRIQANADNRNKHVLPPEDVLAYADFLSDIMQYIDVETILRAEKQCQPVILMTQRLLFFIQLKKRDFAYRPDLSCGEKSAAFMCDGQKMGELSIMPIRLMQLDYKAGCLEIDAGYYDFITDRSAQVFASFDGKKYPLTYNQRYSMSKYFGVTAFRQRTFHVSIPVEKTDKERLLNFVLCAQGKEYTLDYVFPAHGSRFAKDFGYAYWRFGDYLSFWQKNGIHVIKSRPVTVLRKEVALWLQMWKKKNGFYRYQIPIKMVNFLLRPYYKNKKIWLFMDKIYKGADSSEYIYRYAQKQKDGIRKYYLLDKSSADYARMRKEGYRPLIRGSLKHRLVFLNADMVIASNSTVFAFNDYPFERSLPMRGDVHFDVACVQHGMSIQKIAIAQQRLRDNTRLYFCASKYEIENLSKPVYDYVGYDALKLTGVPRYDGLKDRKEKILVLSPTWRMQSALPVSISEGFARDYNPNFKETEYYKVYNGLINDPRLLSAARKYGYRIQYVLHPIVSPQHDDFDKNDVVEIIPSIGDMSYEKIFCEGALMVTDFSGVQFDFAYMRKPVIYLHHNDIPQHYEEGTFHYDTMGFGEICHTNEELIDVLCRYMEHDCEMPEKYRQRADDFFEYSDNNNCERIYPIMLEHTRNR